AIDARSLQDADDIVELTVGQVRRNLKQYRSGYTLAHTQILDGFQQAFEGFLFLKLAQARRVGRADVYNEVVDMLIQRVDTSDIVFLSRFVGCRFVPADVSPYN